MINVERVLYIIGGGNMDVVLKAGCILLNIERDKIALVSINGEYSFPKGHLEKGETIKECARRETIEETGHDVEIIGEEIAITNYISSVSGENVENHLFFAIDLGTTHKIIDENDKECTEWFEIDEVEEKLAFQNLKNTWKEIKPKIIQMSDDIKNKSKYND